MSKVIEGFSKLSKSEKIDWITKTHFKDPKLAKKRLEQYWNNNSKLWPNNCSYKWTGWFN